MLRPTAPPRPMAIFAEALDLASASERAGYLDRVCAGDPELRGRVEELLRAHEQAGDFLESPAMTPMIDAVPPTPIECPGGSLGPYRLLEPIGEGGMGVVYVAEQSEPIRRRVALKVIKPGMDTKQVVARFEAERQALALMDHPNIAKVHDGGMTPAGRPYFVMELVRGQPITQYCDQQQLSIAGRLEIFVLVCRAVQHAHQKGVIHRDLKPSNVLVTVIDGVPVPKIIDFGVAKATGQSLTDRTLFTGVHQIIGTPLYMSPEQVDLAGVDVDTRSDIYSLGVLLYELLSGTTPFDPDTLARAAYDEMRRMLHEVEPPKPSTRLNTLGQRLASVSARRQTDPRRLDRALRGELDWIVMRCLEKDRKRRYETATGLAADLMRYLTDQPVEAGPPTAWYRFSKFARRYRAGLMTGLLLALTLIAGTLVSLRQAVRAVKAEQAAERRAGETRLVTEFLVKDVLGSAAPAEAAGKAVRVSDLIDSAENALATQFANQPRLEASMRTALGQADFALGRYADAERNLRRALEIRERLLGPEHPETLETLSALVPVVNPSGFHNMARKQEAIRLARRSAESHRRVFGAAHPATLAAHADLGDALIRAGNLQEASDLLQHNLGIQQKVQGAGHPETLWTMTLLGQARCRLGAFGEAANLLGAVVRSNRLQLGPGHPATLKGIHELAHVYRGDGQLQKAAELYLEAAEGRRAYYGFEHIMVSSSMGLYVETLEEMGDGPVIRAFCERWLREGLETPISLDLHQRERRAVQLSKLAYWLATMVDAPANGDFSLGLRAAREAVQIGDTREHHRARLAVIHFRLGDSSTAEHELREALRQHNGGDAFEFAAMALVLAHRGDREAATEWFERATQWCLEHESRDAGFWWIYREAALILGLDPEVPEPRGILPVDPLPT
ncbi:protein kinase domain-containing protein [Tautonia rosea]|uniref:protein kinase domain-containing protein n=1 Tax=Tautonia rosea TaxID=2728037 RepID=UPI001474940E|nr:tetratricopeptide repeat protein [Tautonia rosea]